MIANNTARKPVKRAIAKRDQEELDEARTAEQLLQAIRVKAYELYQLRAGGPGSAEDDWVAAEKIVLKKISAGRY